MDPPVPEGFGVKEKGVFPGCECYRVWADAGWSSRLLVAAVVGLVVVVRLPLEAGRWRQVERLCGVLVP